MTAMSDLSNVPKIVYELTSLDGRTYTGNPCAGPSSEGKDFVPCQLEEGHEHKGQKQHAAIIKIWGGQEWEMKWG